MIHIHTRSSSLRRRYAFSEESVSREECGVTKTLPPFCGLSCTDLIFGADASIATNQQVQMGNLCCGSREHPPAAYAYPMNPMGVHANPSAYHLAPALSYPPQVYHPSRVSTDWPRAQSPQLGLHETTSPRAMARMIQGAYPHM